MSALTGPMRRALRAFNPADTECRTSPGAIPHGTIKALRSRGLLTVPGFDLTEKGRMEAERARQRVIGG